MTPEDQRLVDQWAATHRQALTLHLIPDSGEAGLALRRFGQELRQQIPSLIIKQEREPSLAPVPSLVLGMHRNVVFQAVPAGKLLPPFLEALGGAHAPPPVQTGARLEQIDLPAALKLYIAPGCPHCPRMLAQLLSLALTTRHIQLTVIDAALFSDGAAGDQIRSVPTLILDDQMRWTGQLDTEEFIDMCVRRDPGRISAAALRQLLEAGEAARAARMMIAHGRVFPALIELLLDERWSVRLGAMVSVEYLTAEAPAVADGLSNPLWERLAGLPEPVQGDVVHVLSQLDPTRVRGRLQAVVGGTFPESVKDVAAEALAAMDAASGAA
jgi:glutaredoxin